jgi:hypothetical protein
MTDEERARREGYLAGEGERVALATANGNLRSAVREAIAALNRTCDSDLECCIHALDILRGVDA